MEKKRGALWPEGKRAPLFAGARGEIADARGKKPKQA